MVRNFNHKKLDNNKLYMQLGFLACTTICLALKADSQLQKDGRKLAKLMLSLAQRNLHQKIPFLELDVKEHSGL